VTSLKKLFLRKRARDACVRNKDDFCPRKQLENLQDRCGESILDLCEKMQEDGSISVTVIDRNDTLQKYQDEMDSSLNNVIESELKKRYDMKVKVTISRQSAAKARTIKKAKAYNDIDWESSIYSKTLENCTCHNCICT
jgi:hypothetical protein